jgi:hypothetical protein
MHLNTLYPTISVKQGAEMHHTGVLGTVGYSSSAEMHLVTPNSLKSAKQGA